MLQMLGCNRTDDFSTPVSSGSNMGSIARFPKLDECAHFHYEHVELDSLEVFFYVSQSKKFKRIV